MSAKARVSIAWSRRLTVAALVVAVAVGTAGLARADGDGITKTGQTTVAAVPITCNFSTPNTTSFSFDISWVDADARAYLLADRSHGVASSDTEGGLLSGATTGDILYIDVDNPAGATALLPPANDPFAGIRCDANANFGGSTSAGRNEITGPNGVFTVNGVEAWAGDGPSYFNPGQTNAAADYAGDPCNSSVRVFSLITGRQTDHINLGGCFRTDEGAFDPDDQVALFANPSEQPVPSAHATALNNTPFITLISTVPVAAGQHHKIFKQINFDGTNGTVLADGGIEQAVYSHVTGRFYISIPGTSTHPGGYIAVVNPTHGLTGKAIHVVKNIALKSCSPNGLAIAADGRQLYLGCSAAPTMVLDIGGGGRTVIDGTTGGCDEVAYDEGDNSFYGACTDSNPNRTDNLDVVDAGSSPNIDVSINTGASGAHSVAADSVTVTEWMPMFGGLCGTNIACVATFGSTGGDDGPAGGKHRHKDALIAAAP